MLTPDPASGRPLTKGQYAYQQLRSMILAGDLEPEAELNQDRLAVQLGISVSPVREAVRQLQTEGLVSAGSHNLLRVAPLRAAEAAVLLEVRNRLDPMAVRMAAQARTDEDLRLLDQTLADLKPMIAGAGREAITAHRRFHRALYAASGSPLLVELLDRVWDKADRYRFFALRSPQADRSRLRDHQQHVALLEAVRDQLPDRAEELMAAHIEQSLGADWERLRPQSG